MRSSECMRFENVFQGEVAFHFAFAIDLHAPRRGFEVTGVLRRVFLVGAEFVEIVVGGDVLVTIGRFLDAELGALGIVKFLHCGLRAVWPCQMGHIGNKTSSHGRFEQVAAVEIRRFRRDLRGQDLRAVFRSGATNQHGGTLN